MPTSRSPDGSDRSPPAREAENEGRRRRVDIERALVGLRQAYDYALDVERDIWDFAVEIEELRQTGLTDSDLRWLVCKGFVEHRMEMTTAEDQKRVFRTASELKFDARSSFVLTSLGVAHTESLNHAAKEPSADARTRGHGIGDSQPHVTNRAEEVLPFWDEKRHKP
jgi:hypothetical protein